LDTSAGSIQADVRGATPRASATGRQVGQPRDGTATRFRKAESSLPALLQKVADAQPNRAAYKFIDYEVDPGGFVEVLTWSQVRRRALIVAQELRLSGSSGDRVAIVAPQGLHYIVAFLGALEAGFIAVPLPAPQFGFHDERITSALRDCSPAVILTTSSVLDHVCEYARRARERENAAVVAVDSLDLDSPGQLDTTESARAGTAYLQYTSGSTREPAGVVVSHRNVIVNCEQLMSDYFEDAGKVPTTSVSWLPFYHDMGLLQGIILPMINQDTAVLMSPVSFLQRPARWMQLLGKYFGTVSSAPNFGFELAARRTSDDDMAGLELGNVRAIINGGERPNPLTLRRFADRFAPFNLNAAVIRPSYGLAEATLYVATAKPGHPPKTVRFDHGCLSAGTAKCSASQAHSAAELVSYGAPRASTVCIVDPDTRMENPPGTIGELWVHGDNVATGYWHKDELTERTFHAMLADPAPGTPAGPWLRTGDLGVIFDDELFVTGRIKDLLVVDGSNHYPDDIEATIHEITGGQVVTISVPGNHTERLVAIVELSMWGNTRADATTPLGAVKREVTAAVAKSHGLRIADLVVVPAGAIPITTSGKVRRFACVERYLNKGFHRLDVPA
jgi:acyl-CoA synthetase (AMP-forming)/AMP-acid ligase II